MSSSSFYLGDHQLFDSRRYDDCAWDAERPGSVHGSKASVAATGAKNVGIVDVCGEFLHSLDKVVSYASAIC